MAVLLLFTFLDESVLLHVEILGRNLLFYITLFSVFLAVARSLVPNDHNKKLFEPRKMMRKVVTYTHFLPIEYRGRCHTYETRDMFSSLFELNVFLFLKELGCILLMPFFLAVILPQYAEKIIKYVSDNTSSVEGVGDVCTFSLLNLRLYGDPMYGSPRDATHLRGKQLLGGKMEKSWLTFYSNYSNHVNERDDGGKVLLKKLAGFQESTTKAQLVKASKSFSSILGQSQQYQAQSSIVCSLAGSMVLGMGDDAKQSTHAPESFFKSTQSVLLPLSSVKFANGESLFYWLEVMRDELSPSF